MLNFFKPMFRHTSQNIFATFSNSSINNNLHLIASTYFEKDVKPLDAEAIDERLAFFKMSRIILLHVSDEPQLKSLERYGSTLNHEIVVFSVSYEEFFTKKFLHEAIFAKNKIASSNFILFCFSDRSWFHLVHSFKECGISVSGGSSSKRHILSSVQLRLSQYLIIIRGIQFNSVIESFHHFEKINTNPLVDLTNHKLIEHFKEISDSKSVTNLEPIIESNKTDKEEVNTLINKETKDNNLINTTPCVIKQNNTIKVLGTRKYHTSTRSNNIKINKEELDNKALSLFQPLENIVNDPNMTFSFLEKIEKLIQTSDLSPYELQYILENSWIKIITSKLDDNRFISTKYSYKLSSVIIKAFETLNLLYKKGQLKRRFPQLEKELNKKEYLILTYTLLLTYHSRLKYTSISLIIGRDILYQIYKSRMIQYKKDSIRFISDEPIMDENENNSNILMDSDTPLKNKFMSFGEFIQNNEFNTSFIVKLGDFFISLLSTFPTNLFEKDYESDPQPFSKHQIAIIKLNNDYLSEIKENIIIKPSSLPMICPPVKWNEDSFGGLIENNNIQEGIITGSQHHNHLTENKENLYNAVNYASQIKFGINNTLLRFLRKEGAYLLESEINKDNKLQIETILQIAKTFSHIPIYLNVNADWRGRLYTQSFFISYQGSDLSNALLQFYDGEVLTEDGLYYLYIYGANNHNENNISKASYKERITWVKTNLDKIINLDQELLLSAENKFTFTAFCLAVKSYHEDKNTLISLPIFLDATCSGIQHFAALLKDFELGCRVNLFPQLESDSVKDIYSEMLGPINEAINEYGLMNPEYSSLSYVKFNRKTLKTSLMTKMYNVTTYGISQQLKTHFHKVTENKNTYYEVDGINGKVSLTHKDIFKISEIVNEQVFILFPSLRNIYKYLLEMSKLAIILNI